MLPSIYNAFTIVIYSSQQRRNPFLELGRGECLSQRVLERQGPCFWVMGLLRRLAIFPLLQSTAVTGVNSGLQVSRQGRKEEHWGPWTEDSADRLLYLLGGREKITGRWKVALLLPEFLQKCSRMGGLFLLPLQSLKVVALPLHWRRGVALSGRCSWPFNQKQLCSTHRLLPPLYQM